MITREIEQHSIIFDTRHTLWKIIDDNCDKLVRIKNLFTMQ